MIEIIRRNKNYYARIRRQAEGKKYEKSVSLKTKNKERAKNLIKQFIEYCESNDYDLLARFHEITDHERDTNLMIYEAINRFLDSKKAVLSEAGYHSYNHILNRFSSYVEGKRLDRVTDLEIESYVRRPGISPATMRKDSRHLKAFWNYCIKMKWIKRIYPEIKFPRQQITTMRKITSEKELISIFRAFDAYHKALQEAPYYHDSMSQSWFKPFCILVYETGLRRKEALQLQACDVHDEQFIHVYHTKSGRERIIPISKKLQDVFIPYIKGMKPNERIFKLTKEHVTKEFKRFAEMAGLRNKTLHGFRHGRVTKWLDAGFNTMEVKELAGHSTVITTQGYSHLAANSLLEKLRKLEE